MRLDASAVTPGLAKRFQKGTEPSAKSSQSGVLPPKREQFACSCCAGAPFPPASASASTAATRTPSLFTERTVATSTESVGSAYKRLTGGCWRFLAARAGSARPRSLTPELPRDHHVAAGGGSRGTTRPGSTRPRLRTVNGYDLRLVFVEGRV